MACGAVTMTSQNICPTQKTPMTDPEPSNGSLICTFADCPDIKLSVGIWPDFTESEDICLNTSVDGRNAHNCLELCTTGYQGLFCPWGFVR
jgi:hypothetical protein